MLWSLYAYTFTASENFLMQMVVLHVALDGTSNSLSFLWDARDSWTVSKGFERRLRFIWYTTNHKSFSIPSRHISLVICWSFEHCEALTSRACLGNIVDKCGSRSMILKRKRGLSFKWLISPPVSLHPTWNSLEFPGISLFLWSFGTCTNRFFLSQKFTRSMWKNPNVGTQQGPGKFLHVKYAVYPSTK